MAKDACFGPGFAEAAFTLQAVYAAIVRKSRQHW